MLPVPTPGSTRRRSGPGWPVVAGLVGLAVAVQFYGLYRPTGPPTPTWFPNADTAEHALGFALPVMLILLTSALRSRARGRDAGQMIMVVVVAVFAGQAVLSEVIQHLFYRLRSGDPLDIAADAAGIALGVLGSRGAMIMIGRRGGRS